MVFLVDFVWIYLFSTFHLYVYKTESAQLESLSVQFMHTKVSVLLYNN